MDVLDNCGDLCCNKITLTFINALFWVSGLTIIWFGISMKIELENYLEISPSYSKIVPYILIGIGFVIFIASTFAFGSIAQGIPTLLYIYGAVLTIFLFAELSIGESMISYSDTILEKYEEGLKINIQRNTDSVHFIQEQMQCCGIYSYKDWENHHSPASIPLSCYKAEEHNCKKLKVLKLEGCYFKLEELIRSQMSVIGNVISALAIITLFTSIMSVVVATKLKRFKYEPIIC